MHPTALITFLAAIGFFTLAFGLSIHFSHKAIPARSMFGGLVAAMLAYVGGQVYSFFTANSFWLSVSVAGWSFLPVFFLFFFLTLPDTVLVRLRPWLVLVLSIPAFGNLLFMFGGWGEISVFHSWYSSFFIVLSLASVLFWERKTKNNVAKKQARILAFTIILTIIFRIGILVAIHDESFSHWQLLAALFPFLGAYQVIRHPHTIPFEPNTQKSRVVFLVSMVALYLFFSILLFQNGPMPSWMQIKGLPDFTVRSLVAQLQMITSIYLVLHGRKSGFIAALTLNGLGLLSTILFIMRANSLISAPGIISYTGVMILILLIRDYNSRFVSSLNKINAQKESLEAKEKELYELAYYDSLTGLANKDLFIQKLGQCIQENSEKKKSIGVMFIDIDSFKSINDTAGHAIGNEVLKTLSSLFSSRLQQNEILSRFGGDEFLIAVSPLSDTREVEQLAKWILKDLEAPIKIGQEEYFISASIGIAYYPQDGQTTDTLIMNADIAMYAAKAQGKNQWVVASEEMKSTVTRRLLLTNNLYRALDKNELSLVYQPQVCVRTQSICGFEALLRWNHESYGPIPPSTFIPMAEKTGLIKPIGLWVFKQAFEQLKQFQAVYRNQPLTMSVNLSLLQLKDASFLEQLNALVQETHTETSSITIEITESIALSNEPIILQRLVELKDLGFGISIDDFGTGHASFTRLKYFPFDALKLDGSFIQGISGMLPKDLAIIDSLIQIAKNLNVQLVAEGVETQEQYQYLIERGCDKIQGYYCHRPLSIAAVIALLGVKDSSSC